MSNTTKPPTIYTDCAQCAERVNPQTAVEFDLGYYHPECLEQLKEAIEGPDAADIREVGRQIVEMLLRKNKAYGSSFSKPIGIFSKLDKIEALNVRIDDKLSRIREAKDFSEDTEMDLLGYLFLKRVAQMQIERGATPPPVPPKCAPFGTAWGCDHGDFANGTIWENKCAVCREKFAPGLKGPVMVPRPLPPT